MLDARDIAPIGYAFFAFAVGALAGAVLRRTLPAMAATLAVVVVTRIAVAQWVRPHLLSPVHKAMSLLTTDRFGFGNYNSGPMTLIADAPAPDNAWGMSTRFVTPSGHVATVTERAAWLQQHCPGIALPAPGNGGGAGVKAVAQAGSAQAFDSCRQQAAAAYHLVLAYQPAGRYWAFQWMETGIFVALGLAALAGCYGWVTRRIA